VYAMAKPNKLEYAACEGSAVVFDALEFTMDKRAGNTKSFDESDHQDTKTNNCNFLSNAVT
jgi:hypothetical protein